MTTTVLLIYFLAEKENSFIIEPMLQSHHRQSAKKIAKKKEAPFYIGWQIQSITCLPKLFIKGKIKLLSFVKLDESPVPEIPEKVG